MKLTQIQAILLVAVLVLGVLPRGAVFGAAICDVFTVTPTTAAPGDFVTLDWSTTNTISVEIDVLTGPQATSGSALYEVPNTPGLLSINLTAFDEYIFEPSDAFCTAELAIEAPPICDLFTATPDTIDGPGDVTLEWQTTGADISVTIDNGVGFVAEDDVLIVPVAANTTFTLTAENSFGTTTCAVPVTVNSIVTPTPAKSSSGGGKSINPKCELAVSASEVKLGDTVMVSWTSNSANQLNLSTNQSGQVNMILSTTTNLTMGSVPVVITKDTIFTAEVTRPNRSSNCAASVVVKPDNLFEAGIAGATGFIALANVPETGLDPTIGFLIVFNLFLVFGAMLGAYVLVKFTQQYRHASDRSFRDLHVFTPIHALFVQERRYLQSRIMLWKWVAFAVPLTALVAYIL